MKPLRRFTNAEICLSMAEGIERSANECESIGAVEKAANMRAWSADLRAEALEPEDPEDMPAQADLFAEVAQ